MKMNFRGNANHIYLNSVETYNNLPYHFLELSLSVIIIHKFCSRWCSCGRAIASTRLECFVIAFFAQEVLKIL